MKKYSLKKMTSTFFIDRFLRGLSRYVTCLPSDMVSNVKDLLRSNPNIPCPCFFVINTAPSHIHNNGHWLLLTCHNNNNIELFDSLALTKDQLPTEILQFLQEFKVRTFSHKPIQSPLSNFCAIYAIARALSVSKGESLSKFQQYFHNEMLHKNDLIATQYILDSIPTLY